MESELRTALAKVARKRDWNQSKLSDLRCYVNEMQGREYSDAIETSESEEEDF